MFRVRRALALGMAVAAVVGAAPAAGARDASELGTGPGRLPEVRRLAALRDELDGMLQAYRRLESRAGRIRLRAVEAIRAAEGAEAAVAAAELALDERVRTAFQLGPGASVEALLGASTLADLATISEYTARAIAVDGEMLRQTVLAQAVASATRAKAEAAGEALQPRLARLRSMLDEMQVTLAEAAAVAAQATLDEQARRAFEEQQRAIADALARSGSWDLGVIGYGEDQSHLLSLLGPTGGRTCDAPPGLVPTGRVFSGFASWYGWEFAGNPTATGAIFDPALFTAANRWLPFGTFLRIRHGDRCAIVLVNDRGPFGREERVIDLSMAAAQYLSVGVSWVDAEILVPGEGLGG